MSALKRFLLMMTLTLMWSPSFLFIKLAVHEIPPLTLVSLRVTLAAVILTVILLWKRTPLPTDGSFWFRTSLMAIFASVGPFCLFCYAEQSIDSALTAILNGTMPMFTALLAQIFVPSDRINLQKFLGIAFSMCGVVLLFAPQLQEGVDGTTIGMMAATLAAFSYAIGHVYGKLYSTGQKPFVVPTAQFIICSLMLWPFALWHDDALNLPMPSLTASLSVCFLAVFGTVVAFVVYYKLLDNCGPTAVSTVGCFFPVGGMLLGCVFLDETMTMTGLIASCIILLGMVTVNEIVSLNFLSSKKRRAREIS